MTKKRALVATTLVIVLAAVALAVVLGGRGGTPGSGDTTAGLTPQDTGGSSGSTGSGDVRTPGASALKESAGGASVRDASATAPLSRAVISTGQVTLHSTDLARARSEAVRLVTSWGGSVADEQSSSDRHGRLAESTLVLRVPSDHFAEALNAFGRLGEVEQRSQKSEDVTTQVIDNDARVRAARRSIDQIELLLSRAQRIGDIIAIENDLARRQADLDSLTSQQAWLKDQTTLSTITVYLSRPTAAPPAHDTRGFLAGLENGWHALGGATVAALTALGAVLPFALLAALVGVPLAWVVRRRRAPHAPVEA